MNKRYHFKKSLRLHYLPAIAGALYLISAILFFFYTHNFIPNTSTEKYPEVSFLTGKNMDFNQLKAYFKELADKKGAVYAYEVLNIAPVPFGTDMHLMGHVVGDELFHQKGAEGIKYCTQDFRNACSHSIVVNLFYDKGEVALSEIASACNHAPGDGAYTMCYHGLGHGIFSYNNYELPKTVEMCKKTATQKHNQREYTECVGGAIMEQISGGDHDRTTWGKMRPVNLHRDDPLYPCVSQVITDTGPRKVCLIYLTPYLWELGGWMSQIPTDEVIKKSFSFCDQIPLKDTENRDGCFGGFGKEFVPLAKGKDIRNIDKLTDAEIQKVYNWCFLTDDKEGQKSCVSFATGSIYWSGSIDKKYPEHFCMAAPNEEVRNFCFKDLITNVKEANKDINYMKEFCNEIPKSVKKECQKHLLEN